MDDHIYDLEQKRQGSGNVIIRMLLGARSIVRKRLVNNEGEKKKHTMLRYNVNTRHIQWRHPNQTLDLESEVKSNKAPNQRS